MTCKTIFAGDYNPFFSASDATNAIADSAEYGSKAQFNRYVR